MEVKILTCKKCKAFFPHKKVTDVFVSTPEEEIQISVYVCIPCGEAQQIVTKTKSNDSYF